MMRREQGITGNFYQFTDSVNGNKRHPARYYQGDLAVEQKQA
jgi:hypothetical protein